MEITGRQSAAARALIGWSVADLAQAASVGTATIKRFEAGGSVRDASVSAINQAFAGAGVQFIAAGAISADGGDGLRLSGRWSAHALSVSKTL